MKPYEKAVTIYNAQLKTRLISTRKYNARTEAHRGAAIMEKESTKFITEAALNR